MPVRESKINKMTSHHIARLLGLFEDRFPSMSSEVREFIRAEIRKDYWLLSLDIRRELFKRGVLNQDDKDRKYDPQLEKRD